MHSYSKFKPVVTALSLFALVGCGTAHAQPPAGKPPTGGPRGPVARFESWERSFADELGLAPPRRYALGVLRFSRLDGTREGPALVLELAEELNGSILLRRIEAQGGYGKPYRVVRLTEKSVRGKFEEKAYAILDLLSDPAERRAIRNAGPEANVQGCTIHGELIAVEVETRDELPISFARRSACRGSVMRAPNGIYGAITYEDVLPKDPILTIEPLFEAMMAAD